MKQDVNARFAVPTLIGWLRNLERTQKDEVMKTRFQILAILLEKIEDDKMWKLFVSSGIADRTDLGTLQVGADRAK